MKYKFNDDDEKCSFSSNMNQLTIEYLIAYIQFAFWEITKDYALSASDIIEVLCNMYDAVLTDTNDNQSSIIIDINENWERYCSAATIIQSIELFANADLNLKLTDIYTRKSHK